MLKSFLDLFLKVNCPLCERPAEQQLCIYCEKQLKQLSFSNAESGWHGELPTLIWGNYNGLLKRAIANLKYDGKVNLGEIFGYWLGEKWLNSALSKQYQKLIVVPIPLHQEKLKSRGFNQSEIMAKSFCDLTKFTLKANGLKRVKNTAALFGLNVEERQKEIKDSLILGKDFEKKLPTQPILLLDDIYTTGTTVKEAKKALEKHHLKVIGVIALTSSKH